MTDVNEGMKRALELIQCSENSQLFKCKACGSFYHEQSAMWVGVGELGLESAPYCPKCGVTKPDLVVVQPWAVAETAIRAIQAGGAQETWRDISSAPKDGRWTLLKKKEPMEQRPWLLRWDWGNDLWTEDGRSGWGDYLFDAWTPAPQLPQPPKAPNAHL